MSRKILMRSSVWSFISLLLFSSSPKAMDLDLNNIQSSACYKIENKWHRDQKKPSSLDADSDHPQGRIYRSNYDNDNTSWYFTRR